MNTKPESHVWTPKYSRLILTNGHEAENARQTLMGRITCWWKDRRNARAEAAARVRLAETSPHLLADVGFVDSVEATRPNRRTATSDKAAAPEEALPPILAIAAA